MYLRVSTGSDVPVNFRNHSHVFIIVQQIFLNNRFAVDAGNKAVNKTVKIPDPHGAYMPALGDEQ